MANEGLDVITRHRYLRHLVEAEGVTRDEGIAFLDVLSAGLAGGEPEADAMRGQVEARIAMLNGLASAVASADVAEAEAARADAARGALERLARAPDGVSPERLRAYANRALANLPRATG